MTVPGFNCDSGTEIPLNKDPIMGRCDEPARLNSACNVGNRFTVLKPKINEDQDAYAVAHCRKKASGYYGSNLLQWRCNNTQKNQQFILESVSEKIFQIRAVHSGQCLDVARSKKKNTANVIQWPCKKTQKNQQWELNGYLK